MLRPLAITIVLLLMVPTIYVLFFTSIVDRLLLYIRTGRKAKTIRRASEDFDRNVATLTRDVLDERHAADQAVKELEGVINRRFPAQVAEKPWAIRNTLDPDLFWSRSGWVSKEKSTRFDADEKLAVSLPSNGKWYRFRKSPVTE